MKLNLLLIQITVILNSQKKGSDKHKKLISNINCIKFLELESVQFKI